MRLDFCSYVNRKQLKHRDILKTFKTRSKFLKNYVEKNYQEDVISLKHLTSKNST